MTMIETSGPCVHSLGQIVNVIVMIVLRVMKCRIVRKSSLAERESRKVKAQTIKLSVASSPITHELLPF